VIIQGGVMCTLDILNSHISTEMWAMTKLYEWMYARVYSDEFLERVVCTVMASKIVSSFPYLRYHHLRLDLKPVACKCSPFFHSETNALLNLNLENMKHWLINQEFQKLINTPQTIFWWLEYKMTIQFPTHHSSNHTTCSITPNLPRYII